MHKCFKGGTNGTIQKDILRYDGTTDKWLWEMYMKNPRSSVALKIWHYGVIGRRRERGGQKWFC